MKRSLSDIEKELPSADRNDYRALNASLFRSLDKTCIVIDDDPTGNQTVYDIPLLSDWSQETIAQELKNKTPVFFILTNSRSLTREEAYRTYLEVGRNISAASAATHREYVLVSRSDSTLRGHFKEELDALRASEAIHDAITFFIPVMFEGGRVTINNIHYIAEQDTLIPVADTPFARDATFGYSQSDLGEWVEEKTAGEVRSGDIRSFSVEEIRTRTTAQLVEKVRQINIGETAICNALGYTDLDKMLQALLIVGKEGRQVLYRTSSSFLPSFIGQAPKPLLSKEELNLSNNNGGLIVVGSHVSRSSEQLSYLLERTAADEALELDVEQIMDGAEDFNKEKFSGQIDELLSTRQKVILYTSRKLITGTSAKGNLEIGARVSNALVEIVSGLKNTPKYIMAKGGITAHDLATRALGMNRAMVRGQILPGVPVWEITGKATGSGIPYIVFPGNVGQKTSLHDIIQKLG